MEVCSFFCPSWGCGPFWVGQATSPPPCLGLSPARGPFPPPSPDGPERLLGVQSRTRLPSVCVSVHVTEPSCPDIPALGVWAPTVVTEHGTPNQYAVSGVSE